MIRIFFLIVVLLVSPSSVLAEKLVLRVGHFPNITHAQGVIGHGLSRLGKGWFEQRLGTNVQVQWLVYNAGPSAMEAIFAKTIDITYVGPMPVSEQGNNAISGTQHLDKETLRLNVTGLVRKDLSFSYQDLLELPAYAEQAYMPCVEGWGFDAKWTGFRVSDLLNMSGLLPQASYVVFYSADGYSTGLPLDYLRENQILLAYGINDITLPAERGFPLQLVAKSRYGYKWAKWITSIEVVDSEVRGYWESRGYSNSAKVGELAFG